MNKQRERGIRNAEREERPYRLEQGKLVILNNSQGGLRRRNNRMNQSGPVNRGYEYKFNGGKLQCTIKHRELLTPITGGQFSQVSYKIQPGLPLSFPWLSNIAPNFETYEFNKLDFEFVSKLPTTQGGFIWMAIDYDAADSPVVDGEQEIAQYDGVVTGKVWQNHSLHMNPQKRRRPGKLYTRTGVLPNNTAIQDYDIGTFICCVSAGDADLNVGSIYVNYTITLSVPQPYDIGIVKNNSISTYYPVQDRSTSNVTNLALFNIGAPWSTFNSISQGLNFVANQTEYFFTNVSDVGTWLYQFVAELDGSVPIATVNDIIAKLSLVQSYGSNTMTVLDNVLGLPTGNIGMVQSTIGGAYRLIGQAILQADRIGMQFSLNLASHLPVLGTAIQEIVQRVSPYDARV